MAKKPPPDAQALQALINQIIAKQTALDEVSTASVTANQAVDNLAGQVHALKEQLRQLVQPYI
jgi:hypothetical protein